MILAELILYRHYSYRFSIASAIIALVIVGFAFGLFSATGGKPTVTQVGRGTLTQVTNSKTHQTYYIAIFTSHSTGSVQTGSIVGYDESASKISPISLSAGLNSVALIFPTESSFNPQPGTVYQVSISLGDDTTVRVAVEYSGYTIF